jgi:hypothetical protein
MSTHGSDHLNAATRTAASATARALGKHGYCAEVSGSTIVLRDAGRVFELYNDIQPSEENNLSGYVQELFVRMVVEQFLRQ